MTLDIPTLQDNVARLQQDGEALALQIKTLTENIAAAQNQLVRLHGAAEYNALAVKRATEQLAGVQAAAAVSAAPTS